MSNTKTKDKVTSITLKNIYLEYPYKTRPVLGNTVPIPYFPKEEITNHKYTISYKEWKNVLIVYFKYIVKYLLTGASYKLPGRLGEFELRRYIPSSKNRKINWKKTNELYGEWNKNNPDDRKRIYHANMHTEKYCPFLVWVRHGSEYNFAQRWLWRFKLSKRMWSYISNEILEDSSLINNLNTNKIKT
jgi:hypothetical protein